MRRDLIALPEDSKVWIYQSKSEISTEDTEAIMSSLYDFTMKWASHGHELESYANVFHYRFVVLVADGSHLPSGCSIDASVHMVEDLGKKHGLELFDRMQFAYFQGDHIATMHSSELPEAYKSGKVSDDTLFFNNLVNNKRSFLDEWIIPLRDSWHSRFI